VALALPPDAKRWLVGKHDCLVLVKALGQRFRAQLRVGVGQTRWAGQGAAGVCAKSWLLD